MIKLPCPEYVHVHPYDELGCVLYILSYRIGEATIQAFTMPEPDEDNAGHILAKHG
jgi:hypothetical protein